MTTWKVQIRKKCKICSGNITGKRFRTYCSAKCRNRANAIKSRDSGYSANYQRIMWAKKRENDGKEKIKCVICGKSYRQICSHTVLTHGITGREYRKMLGLDVKRGLLPEDYRKEKSEQAYEHWPEIVGNLRKGKRNWFKPGDPRAGKYERSEQTKERLKKGTKYLIEQKNEVH